MATRPDPKNKSASSSDQRRLRTQRIVFVLFSLVLIVAMILPLVAN